MELSFLSIPSILNPNLQIQVSYQVFGIPIGLAPVVLVNHALTGNSLVTGSLGWWKDLIGDNKTINTQKYTIIAFNIPGNGFDNITENLINDYQNFTTKIIAQLFWRGLDILKIEYLYAIIGGSLGGAVAWEMVFLQPNRVQNLIPVATNYKTSDWLIGNVFIQESILSNSKFPIEDARKHAMFLYRSPEGINDKFNGAILENEFKVENWLRYHGNALKDRFTLQAYKLMNHLLKTIGNSFTESDLQNWSKIFKGNIHIISVDTDLMFTAKEQNQTYNLIKNNTKAKYSEIISIHGHDAFLIEFKQLSKLLQNNF